VSFYSSTNIDDVGPIIEAFEDEYDLDVSHYRAGASTVMQRILQEADANFAGSDVVQINGPEMLILDNEGLLLPLETPLRETIVEPGRYDNWLAAYVNSFIVGWNTNLVSDDDRPKTYEELLEYDGSMAFDVDDFDWFHTLTTEYFGEELGWSEEETVEAFKDAMRGGDIQVMRGHSLGAELLGAGEFSLHASMYHHHLPRIEGTGADWQPAIEPVIVRPNGVGIIASTERPATALLFTEFMLTVGQEMFAEVHRTPGSTEVDGGLPPDVETVGVDLEELDENRAHWEGLWEEIVQEAGGEVIEEED
jgi:iron(III) transport system substrate-binding protein